MIMQKILAINSGSSSFKFKLFETPSEEVITSGIAERVGMDGSFFEIKYQGKKQHFDVDIPDQEAAVNLLLHNLIEMKIVSDLSEIKGVGHRIVAGGEDFKESTVIDEDNLKKIYDLSQYAPLHNPAEARGIEAFMKLLPGVPQVGVFDTSFHTSMPMINYLYSLPYEYYEKFGARKYGAHGTSVRYVSQRAAEMLGRDIKELKLIVCHLGSGASITAVQGGKSLDTSMGFTPLAGVTMGTRTGDIDASLIPFLIKKLELKDAQELIDIFNNKSGLLGISGVSPDMRDVEATFDQPRSRLAHDIFINRIVRYIGQYVFEMGGLDGLIFTAGIGEHSIDIRDHVVRGLDFYGARMDWDANIASGERFINTPESTVKLMVIPTDEELMIVRDVVALTK